MGEILNYMFDDNYYTWGYFGHGRHKHEFICPRCMHSQCYFSHMGEMTSHLPQDIYAYEVSLTNKVT